MQVSRNIFKTWKNVLTKPSEQTFSEERNSSSATLSNALAWVLLASVAAVFLSAAEKAIVDMWEVPIEEMHGHVPSDLYVRLSMVLVNPIVVLTDIGLDIIDLYAKFWSSSDILLNAVSKVAYPFAGFVTRLPEWQAGIALEVLNPVLALIRVFLYHYIAILLGGKGKIGRYAYLVAAFGVPLTILSSLIDFLPWPQVSSWTLSQALRQWLSRIGIACFNSFSIGQSTSFSNHTGLF